ncbi:hypothetical protein AAW31_16255 [Nitrosomonas communis]|uniref:Uncharacterized protein n=1 Tax=Nitrosomonas communis TaxID=44574 RepID=A0A0F7KJ97_9PROT|nr:hypothetical protein AAW31_16255 [Nitrosomonas communis]
MIVAKEVDYFSLDNSLCPNAYHIFQVGQGYRSFSSLAIACFGYVLFLTRHSNSISKKSKLTLSASPCRITFILSAARLRVIFDLEME